MALKISGSEHPLSAIFSDAFSFRIPSYQRPYSWTVEHADELFEDVQQASRDGGDDPYFLGSIVLAKQEHEPTAEVIDGQQRLTTLTILLAALAHVMPPGEREMIHQRVIAPGDKFADVAAEPRLTPRPKDADFFLDHIQRPGALGGLADVNVAAISDPQRNMVLNARHLLDRVQSLGVEGANALAKYLLKNCYLVAVSTPDTTSAFRVFTVLNDRGLDLTHADILKADIIGSLADPAAQEQATKIWEDAEEELGSDEFAVLFSHLRMIYARRKQQGTLIEEVRKFVVEPADDMFALVDDVIAPYADVLAKVRAASWKSVTHAESINQSLRWLGMIDNFDWIPPTLRFMRQHDSDPATIATFLQRLDRLASSMFIRRVYVNPRIARYGAVLTAIEEGRVLADDSPIDLTEKERAETRERLDGDVYLIGKTVKYILLRLDARLMKGLADYAHDVISVEHVLPQHPKPDSVWVRDFTDEQRERWTHRLANLVLLPQQKNAAAQNYDFDKKKAGYFSGKNGVQPYALTTQVLATDRWTPDHLEERQRQLLGELVNLWDLGVRS